MEQSPISTKTSLPAKTKIVAWAMMVIGAVCGVSLFLGIVFIILCEATNNLEFIFEGYLVAFFISPTYFLISPNFSHQANDWISLFPYFLLTFLMFIFGFFLLKKINKKFFWGSLIILLIYLVINLWTLASNLIRVATEKNATLSFNLSLFIPIILIIFLLLDWKKHKESIKIRKF